MDEGRSEEWFLLHLHLIGSSQKIYNEYIYTIWSKVSYCEMSYIQLISVQKKLLNDYIVLRVVLPVGVEARETYWENEFT